MTTSNNANNNAEKLTQKHASERPAESVQLTVSQPKEFTSLLETIDVLGNVSERIREDSSGDLGSGGASSGTGDDASQTAAQSARQKAIEKLPSVPVMRTRLTRHLQREVKQLERKAKTLARSAKKGSAYLLNELYARIRKIQALISELREATEEVVRRLYIRLFIDRQQLV